MGCGVRELNVKLSDTLLELCPTHEWKIYSGLCYSLRFCPEEKMIPITPQLAIDEDELTLRFVRASGPGGQNVNKVSSAVELRFDVAHSLSVPEELKTRLKSIAGGRLTEDGMLVIDAQRFRTQGMNRKDAIARLVALLRAAAIRPKSRIPTRPSRGAREARLESKRKTGLTKQTRRTKINPHD